MKFNYLITFRSITFAQKAEAVLRRADIDCRLQRTPRELSTRGCGYCLQLRGSDALAAVELLRNRDILFGKLYAMGSGGMEERML